MYLGIESMYESSKMLLDYMTHLYGYNNFLIDNIDDNLIRQLSNAIQKEDKVKAVQLYLKIDRELDVIRDKHCYNNSELPYKSNFRAIAKDIYRELKKSWLIYNDELKYVAYILRFISTSDYYQIREMLIKRSKTMYDYWDIPIDPDDWYCNYIPLEAIMDYCIKIVILYMKEV